MSKREEALRAFNEHFAFKDNPIAWSAWKMAWDLAYNRALEDAEKRVNEVSDWGQFCLDDLKI